MTAPIIQSVLTWPRVAPPPPIETPPLYYLLHDYESADVVREQFAPDGFLPRTYRDTHAPSLPETTKEESISIPQEVEWCELERDLIAHNAPAHILKDPPKGILRAEDLKGYVVKNRLEEICLRLNHGNLYKTNHTGWNDEGFYDPLTGAGDSANPNRKPYRRETLTCCGNVVWKAGYNMAWAIDGLAPAPKAYQIWDMPWFVHASTACYGRDNSEVSDLVDPTKTQRTPNGTWRVDPFGDLEGNLVPILFVAANPNRPTMEWNGLHLRQIPLESTRTLEISYIPCPYVPERNMRPS